MSAWCDLIIWSSSSISTTCLFSCTLICGWEWDGDRPPAPALRWCCWSSVGSSRVHGLTLLTGDQTSRQHYVNIIYIYIAHCTQLPWQEAELQERWVRDMHGHAGAALYFQEPYRELISWTHIRTYIFVSNYMFIIKSKTNQTTLSQFNMFINH